jgi:S1-C subfamily serine protease
VLFPEPAKAPTAPPIGIAIEKDDKTGLVSIATIQKGGKAESMGLKKGDAILLVNGTEIEEVEDIYIELYDKKKGDTITLKVLRRKLLFFDSEIEFFIEL